ncbi:MAG: hypothetical protein ACMV1B_09365 [Prevotella sp.]
MLQPTYILTEQEYQDLLKVQNKPDDLLRETNLALKKKLDEAETKLKQGAFDNIRIETPFRVYNESLCLNTPTDFVVMYNSLAKSNLTDSDLSALSFLKHLAATFNYQVQFADVSKLKAYRVSLQKKGLYKPIKVSGKCYLEKDQS